MPFYFEGSCLGPKAARLQQAPVREEGCRLPAGGRFGEQRTYKPVPAAPQLLALERRKRGSGLCEPKAVPWFYMKVGGPSFLVSNNLQPTTDRASGAELPEWESPCDQWETSPPGRPESEVWIGYKDLCTYVGVLTGGRRGPTGLVWGLGEG